MQNKNKYLNFTLTFPFLFSIIINEIGNLGFKYVFLCLLKYGGARWISISERF